VTTLNPAALAALADAGVSPAEWAQANWSETEEWHGDVCGCPDDRCAGHHHDAGQECGCLRSLLEDYADGVGMMFAPTDRKPRGLL
jgi:hypothetical protein